MEKKIYVIRHGETENNLRKILQGGNVDLSLNEKGRAQALAFYNAYKNTSFDCIYISTLRRTRESVQQFIDDGVPYEVSPWLNEISYGVLDGKVTCEGEHSQYNLLLKEWNSGNLNARMEGGESPVEVQQRILRFIDYMMGKKDEKEILICMHGRAMRIFLATILRYDLSEMEMFKHKNLCLYVLNYNSQNYSVERFNDLTHLDAVFSEERTDIST